MLVAALEWVNAVVDAEVIVKVKGLLLGVGASEPSALGLCRLLGVGSALLDKIQDVADDEEREGDEGSPDEKIHVVALVVVWWFRCW
jgi:hypothetical protein